MRVVTAVLKNRMAYLGCSQKTEQRLSEFWSFYVAGARWARSHKLWLHKRQEAIDKGKPTDKLPGWDGKIYFLKRGAIPEGLFRATYREAEEKLGIQFRIEREGNPANGLKVREITRQKDTRYSYQDDCIVKMQKALKRGGGLVLMATGSGKTSLAGRFFASLRKVKCLFVVDTLDLMYQAQKELARWAGEPVGIVGNSEWEPQRITVATRQTLNSNFSRKTAGFEQWLKSMSIVIVDEIHEQMSKKNFAILNLMKPVARYGLTATLQLKKKEVRMKAHAFAGPVVYEFPLSEGTKRGVLSKGRALQLLFPEEWEWTEDNKNYRVEYEAEVVDNVVKLAAVKRITRYLVAKDRYCMTLTWKKNHTWALGDALDEPLRVVCGDVSKDRRRRARNRLERGDIRLLVSSGVFKKGTNLKRVDVIIDIAELRSANDTQQKFGRGVRLHPDKQGLLYIDIGTDTGRFGTRAKARASALRALGIPFEKVCVSDAKEALAAVRKWIQSPSPR